MLRVTLLLYGRMSLNQRRRTSQRYIRLDTKCCSCSRASTRPQAFERLAPSVSVQPPRSKSSLILQSRRFALLQGCGSALGRAVRARPAEEVPGHLPRLSSQSLGSNRGMGQSHGRRHQPTGSYWYRHRFLGWWPR